MTTKKPLRRDTTNRVFTGVCGGLGEHFDISPTIIRILFIALLGSGSLLAYLLFWLFVPEEGSETPAITGNEKKLAVTAAIILVSPIIFIILAFSLMFLTFFFKLLSGIF